MPSTARPGCAGRSRPPRRAPRSRHRAPRRSVLSPNRDPRRPANRALQCVSTVHRHSSLSLGNLRDQSPPRAPRCDGTMRILVGDPLPPPPARCSPFPPPSPVRDRGELPIHRPRQVHRRRPRRSQRLRPLPQRLFESAAPRASPSPPATSRTPPSPRCTPRRAHACPDPPAPPPPPTGDPLNHEGERQRPLVDDLHGLLAALLDRCRPVMSFPTFIVDPRESLRLLPRRLHH